MSLTHRNVLQAAHSPFFSELVSAASSFTFSPDGRHAATRDYMHGSIWDVRQASEPLRTFEVHEHLWEHLMDVYENESIFDRLGVALSPNGQHITLGSYCELAVYNLLSDTFTTLRACGSPAAVNVRSRARLS
jgi:WD40 repeat protein